MLILEDLVTASGKYPERFKSPELTLEVIDNGMALLDKVNALLSDLGIQNVKVSSGFRPSAVNAGIPNAAKKSSHMICKAIDLEDPDGKLDKLIESRPDLLRKYGLFQENPVSTKNWAHLDCADRPDRPSRQFSV